MKNLNDGTKFMIGAGLFFILIILLQSCMSSEVYFAREQARETAYLKRIAADTLARPVQDYSSGLFLNGWVPRYNNGYDGYWYNGVYYGNNGFGPRPLIRLNSNRYVVPYRKSIKRRKYGNRNNRRDRSNSTYHRATKKQRVNGKSNSRVRSPRSNTRRSNSTHSSNKARSVNRPRNKSQKQ